MASLTPQQIVLSNINGGQQFANGDVVTPEAINSPIQASAYAQALATNQPDVSEAGNVGTPSVSIITAIDGTPRFKFSNLKGERGATGASGGSSGGTTTVSGGVKPVFFHTMENSNPINITINERLGQNGAVVAVMYGTSGCNSFRPSISIYYGYFVDDTSSDYESVNEFRDYRVSIASSSQYNSANVEAVDAYQKLNITLNAEDYNDCVFDIDIDKNNSIVYIHISGLVTSHIIN